MSDAEIGTASDARTAPVAVWQILEKLRGQDLIDWRLAETKGRASIAERKLDIGFPFGWYPVLLSKDLAVGEVKPLRYFSTDLAIWRGEDGQAVIEARMANARTEVAQARHFDFVIINALFETALFDLKTVVHSQRLKYAAQLRNRSQVFAALDLV